jgi:hypothetical protein
LKPVEPLPLRAGERVGDVDDRLANVPFALVDTVDAVVSRHRRIMAARLRSCAVRVRRWRSIRRAPSHRPPAGCGIPDEARYARPARVARMDRTSVL